MATALRNPKKIKMVFIWIVLIFFALFSLKFAYEIYSVKKAYATGGGASTEQYMNNAPTENAKFYSSNIATDRIMQRDIEGQSITIDQKYDKTASLRATTTKFGEDDAAVRGIVEKNDAVIQSENVSGLSGSQTLNMTIGVKPDKFDGLVESLKKIGTLKDFTVNKVDKTNEFKKLMAEQKTLEATRQSYVSIKKNGGSVQDLLMIETKILEVEKQLQDLGVNMGVYSTEFSFCTVNITLSERVISVVTLQNILESAGSSFAWSLLCLFVGGCIILALLFGSWLALYGYDLLTQYFKKGN